MVSLWEPGTQYNINDIVTFGGRQYKIIQPHRSQPDWTPPVTPALWGQIPGGAPAYNPSYESPEQQRPPLQEKPSDEKQWHEHEHQKVDIPHDEQKKNWFDLDDKRKKELELGGGLALGIAALGAGFIAYKHHEKNEDTKKAQVWGLQQWLREAQQHTEAFYRNGPQGPTTWVLVHGSEFPQGAIVGGEEKGEPYFIARAFHEGSVQVGKASPRLKEGAVIGYSHDEINFNTFEVLVGDERALRWVDHEGRIDLAELHATPVEGGREGDGTPLFIAKAHMNHAVVPGKCSSRLDGAFIPYDGTEKKVKEYRVLCYA